MTPQRLSKSYKIEENFLKDFGDNKSATKLDKYVSERFIEPIITPSQWRRGYRQLIGAWFKISQSTIFHRYVSTLNKSNQAFALEDVITM